MGKVRYASDHKLNKVEGLHLLNILVSFWEVNI